MIPIPEVLSTESGLPLLLESGEEFLTESSLSTETSQALGIHQSDVVIRTAMVAALRDLRTNPSLLDGVWAKVNPLEIIRAKEWFLKTDIPVLMVPRLDEAKVPCISIALMASDEAEVTLGDVHYDSSELNDSSWPDLTSPFTVTGYNPDTNTVTVPASLLEVLVLAPGMFIVDRFGRAAEILSLEDNLVVIEEVPAQDLTECTIRGKTPPFEVTLESVSYRETYQIGVHASGEPVYLSWLYSIVAWALLRYKETLLEARGFERSSWTAAAFDRNEHFTAEFVFSRYFQLTGFVRHYWPKDFLERPNSFEVNIQVEATTAAESTTEDPQPSGIFQSELAVRSGIINSLNDLRANPWLLDYAFLTLRTDTLTDGQYEAEIDRARTWFMKTEIPVLATPVLDKPRMPCITVKLQGSGEAEVTFADNHYIPTELNTAGPWLPLCQPFTPIGFDPSTGIMRLSTEDLARVPLVVGLFVVDGNGGTHEITALNDDDSFTVTGTGDFKGSVIKGADDSIYTSKVKHLESMMTKDDIQLGVHVSGEPVYLTWLHTILVFCLLRYKESFLEAEGVERTTFNSTDFDRNPDFQSELIFTRYVNLKAFVRQYWVKATEDRITTLQPALRVIGGETLPDDTDPADALWIGEYDTLG